MRPPDGGRAAATQILSGPLPPEVLAARMVLGPDPERAELGDRDYSVLNEQLTLRSSRILVAEVLGLDTAKISAVSRTGRAVLPPEPRRPRRVA